MRKLTLLLVSLLLILSGMAQTPGTFNYQAVIRDASGNVISNKEIQINISIVQGNENGTTVYSEDWTVETNAFGLVNLAVGSMDLESFKAINWMNGPYYFSLSLDGEYLGTSPLLSVPFAQLAQRVVEGGANDADADPTNEIQELSISGHQLTISGGNTITLPDKTKDADSDPTNEIELPIQVTGDANKVLAADGSGGVSWQATLADTKLTEAEVDTYVANNGYQLATDDGDTDSTNEIELPEQAAGDANKVLAANGEGGVSWQAATVDTKLTETEVDNYVANNGYQLAVDDGDTNSTNEIELPEQAAGDANKVLAANGEGGVSWQAATVDTRLTETEVDNYVANNGYQLAVDDGDTDATNEIELPEQAPGDANKVLAANGEGGVSWQAATVDTKLTETEVDNYVANNGYQLAVDDEDTDSTNELELPEQTGNSGKYLTTDGTSVSWVSPSAASSQWTTSDSDIYYNSGNVGIGTTSLGHKLTIEDTGTSNTGVMALNATGDATFTWASSAIAPNLSGGNNIIHIIGQDESEYNAGYIGFNFVESGSSSNFLTFGLHTHDNLLNLTGAGNVGIGTSSPSYKLSVEGGAITTRSGLNNSSARPSVGTARIPGEIAGLGSTDGGDDGFLRISAGAGTTSTQKSFIDLSGYSTVPDMFSNIVFGTSGSERMRIDADGNVGIGTTSPAGKLQISSSSTGIDGKVIISSPSSNHCQLQIGNPGGDEASISFLPNVTSFGTTPVSSGGTSDIWAIGPGIWAIGSTTFGIGSDAYNTNGGSILNITSDGNVGIGTTEPIAPLHVATAVNGVANPKGNTTAKYFNSFDASTALTYNTSDYGQFSYVSIVAAGDIITASSMIAASDERIKTDIKELNNSLNIVKKLRPVQYTKTDKLQYGIRLNYGFIAQEVEEVIPNVVNTGKGEVPVLKPFEKVEFKDGVTYTILVKNGDDIKEQKYTTADARPEGEIIVKSKEVNDFKSLSYDMIFTVAVGAIQEQQATIEAQQKQIDDLKAQNAVLTQKADAIDQLKAEVENLKNMISTGSVQLVDNQ